MSHHIIQLGGVVVLSVECCTCDREVAGSTAGWHHHAVTFGKLFPSIPVHASVIKQYNWALRALMPYIWKGNSMPGKK